MTFFFTMPQPESDEQRWYRQSFEAQVAELQEVQTHNLKAMWDDYDGTNHPLGFEGEAIHLALNLRGEGAYCTV